VARKGLRAADTASAAVVIAAQASRVALSTSLAANVGALGVAVTVTAALGLFGARDEVAPTTRACLPNGKALTSDD
jgi:hypothetical protein